MYRLGRQIHKHRRARKAIGIAILLILLLLFIWWLMHLRITPTQEIRNAPPLSENYRTANSEKVIIENEYFHAELPAGWKEAQPNPSQITKPTYMYTSSASDARSIEFYINNIPQDMAVNKAIVVNAQGHGLAYNSVSENCTTFTDSALKNPQTGKAPAKWQEINFLCDMGNYSRQVVGSISVEGVNTVTVNGATKGPHKLFVVYNDTNINPDYSILNGILASLQFK